MSFDIQTNQCAWCRCESDEPYCSEDCWNNGHDDSREIIMAFWDAVPEALTIEAMAEGMIVEFEYLGNKYRISTKADKGYRTKAMSDYYKEIEDRAYFSVKDREKMRGVE